MLRVVLLSLAVACATAIVCPPNVCQTVRCAAVTAESCGNGNFVAGGGFCGCCDLCVASLAEGEMCFSSLFLGVPSTSRCAAGLECDPQSHRCRKPSTQVNVRQINAMTCTQRLQQIQSASSSGMPLLGQFVPNCATDGTYAARQCHGSVCYCVDSNGVQIGGYSVSVGQSANMNCQCARDQHAYMQTGLIGKMFYCADNGNYQPYRCTGSVCYCADEQGNMKANSPTVNIGNLGSLQC